MRYLSLLLILLTIVACKSEEKIFENEIEEIEDFIAKNGWDAEVTESGLHYVVVEEGIGSARPSLTATVEVTYRGEFFSGEIFDQNLDGVEFPITGVIKGWTEGLQLMKKEAIHYLIIPSRLAYGTSGSGRVPKNTPLFFEVQLLDW